MSLGLKEAGVKVRVPVPEPTSKKPVSPATSVSLEQGAGSKDSFNEAVDVSCLEGVLEKLDGDLYRFNQLY